MGLKENFAPPHTDVNLKLWKKKYIHLGRNSVVRCDICHAGHISNAAIIVYLYVH